jgi:hypothetical protein
MRVAMKMLGDKMGLAAAVALAALFFAEAAHAQKNRAAPNAPKRYDAVQSRPTGSRFTPEEQRIIDQITANDWRNGR